MEELIEKIIELETTKIRLLEVEDELESTKRRLSKVEEELDWTKGRLLKALEELESTKIRLSSRIKRIVQDGCQTSSSRRSMGLEFRNGISQNILTGQEIKGELTNTCVEVALLDASTGNVVDIEPEASLIVEIVVLRGEFDASKVDDWTVEEFETNILRETEDRKPLLAGIVKLRLQGGVATLDNIKFRHHVSKMKPRVFRLGAKVVGTFDGARVKEAKTKPFHVNDFRRKYIEKHDTPSLSDEVFRLKHIGKRGIIKERLKDNNINNVEDFLIRLLIDPQGLETEIVKLGAKKWEDIVKNARACLNEKRLMYCYINSQQKTGVVFNVFGQVLGLYSENQYSPTNILSENHKTDAEELLTSAYKNWKDTIAFDHEYSLHQHFAGLTTFAEPYCPVLGHDNYYGESSNGHSNSSFQSIIPAVNPTGEEGLSGSFINTDDLDIFYDVSPRLSPNPSLDLETMFPDFDKFLKQKADEQMAASGAVFIESQADNMSRPSKRWISLFCVSRWFSLKKLVSDRVNRKTKRQKVC